MNAPRTPDAPGTDAPGTDDTRAHPVTVLGLDFVGLVVGLLFFAWSLSPSLIPRDWLYQGLISGITAVTGYGIGVLIAYPARRWIVPHLTWWRRRHTVRQITQAVVAVLVVALVVAALLVAADRQNEIEALMGMDATSSFAYLRTGLVVAAVFAVVLLIARGLRRLADAFARFLGARLHIPVPIAHVVAPVLLAVLVVVFVDQVLLAGSSKAANLVFSGDNNSTDPGDTQPVEPERSGSPMSTAPWDTLGRQGRSFVDGGARAAELTAINGLPAREPIRVYAGLESAPDTAAQVDLVLDELDRTGAWDRQVLVVSATTGTGWVNPVAADSIELMYNGDTAIAAIQYSYLPSWISFLTDGSAAASAGEALIDGVQERWSQLPEDARPRLLVYGESLGSQSAEAAFDDIADLRSSVDGALFVGPPNSNTLWRSLVDGRDPGSTEVLPTYHGGLEVRFADSVEALEPNGQPWLDPRVLYLQHASDPVVWWGPDLLFTRPDWLSEPPGPDRVPSMRWYPIVTFWQVAGDVMRGTSPPVGHGHNYEDLIPYGWAAIAPPDGWTTADTERVAKVVEATALEDSVPVG
ncbi:alpha/beta hydrolase [Rhodococcus sp. HM1]|uniref:alpha/beta hydrolase n=1 Tax=unclassified Rhodococcus (in: high G+C Gram-positive bacteria) TaxID=192944 RepID=UPI0018CD618B|nr:MULTISPECIES: alpha/beta-hydrolase family protein [unclassified Rhodococcus (in: high G+C Gram-positive bacteria)]MBH0122829.1 alpha/beta hydrolase [Rhodococcus sp. CX]MCK8672879.1 alpha/beta hydrolase [Rhodococcus sp. HM1]